MKEENIGTWLFIGFLIIGSAIYGIYDLFSNWNTPYEKIVGPRGTSLGYTTYASEFKTGLFCVAAFVVLGVFAYAFEKIKKIFKKNK
ncbi:hypothetical protein [Campylobacter devanensis]|uniref:hypothetical protein n=2 Tax=Campylobacter devanensis TaxID=3161138 RepID=UPI000A338DDF|nr:hypothetical protein [Campylobacter sp. P0132]